VAGAHRAPARDAGAAGPRVGGPDARLLAALPPLAARAGAFERLMAAGFAP
jgi:hypothetical protein